MFDSDGNLVQGNVTLNIITVLDKRDMIRHRAPTMTGNGRFLESGGSFYVKAFKDGDALTFDASQTFSVFVPTDDFDLDMKNFVGERDETGNVVWQAGTENLSNWGNPTGTEWAGGSNGTFEFGYELLCDRFGWQNIDKFLDSFGVPATDNRISVSLPEGFGNLNAAGYCILNNFQTVTSLFVDTDNEELYIEGVPEGESVSLLIVSVKEENNTSTFYAELLDIVVETNHAITLNMLTERSLSEIEGLLEAI
jgi:hypothetical protein